MKEDNSSRTSVIVSKKSYFENSKLEEETNNLIQDETLSKNLENISEISKDLIGVNKNANEESQKDVVTDTEGTNDAAKDEDTLSEEMVDLNRISKVLNNVEAFEEDNIDDPEAVDGGLDAFNGTVQPAIKGAESINLDTVDKKDPLENIKTLSDVKLDDTSEDHGIDNDYENQNVITLDEKKSTIDIPKLKSEESSEVTEILDADNSEPVEVKLEPAYDEYLEKTTSPKKSRDTKDGEGESPQESTKSPRKYPVGEFPCVECDYVAKRKDKLNQHFQTQHLGVKYKCDECDSEFTRGDKLKKHKASKHGVQTVYTCEQCTFNSTSHKEYTAHVKIHPSKMFKCNYCSYFTPRPQRLQDHVERKHEHGAYPCDVCGYIAVSTRTLSRHKDSKHSEFQYPCEMCDYKGRRPDHLVAHQRRVHKKMVNSEHVRLNNCVNSDGQHVQSEKKTPGKPSTSILKRETDHGDMKPNLKLETEPITKVESKLKTELDVSDHEDQDDFNYMFTPLDNNPIEPDGLEGLPDEVLEKINPIEWLMQQGALTYDVKREFDEDYKEGTNPMVVKTEIADDYDEFVDDGDGMDDNESGDDDNSDGDYDPSYNPKRKFQTQVDVKTEEGGAAIVKASTKLEKKVKKPKDPNAPKKTTRVKTEKPKKRNGPRDAGPFICDVDGCDFTCARRDKLNFHTNSKHLGVRYPCDICGFLAMRKDKLKLHKERKHFNPQPRKKRAPKYEAGQIHYCDKCDYKNLKMRNLQAHVERVHSTASFTCGECDFVTTFKLNLLKHTERMHGSKILMCDKCSYTTKDPIRLKYHNEAKHDDTKYPCDLCDYIASLRCELQRHFRRKHRGETYKCDQCEYVGKRFDNLRDHKKRIHEVHLGSDNNRSPKTPRRKKPKLKQPDLPMDLQVQPPTGVSPIAAATGGNSHYSGATAAYPGQSVIRGPIHSSAGSGQVHGPHSSPHLQHSQLAAALQQQRDHSSGSHAPHMTAAINSIHNVVDEKPTAEELSIYVNSMNPANRHHNSSLIFQ